MKFSELKTGMTITREQFNAIRTDPEAALWSLAEKKVHGKPTECTYTKNIEMRGGHEFHVPEGKKTVIHFTVNN